MSEIMKIVKLRRWCKRNLRDGVKYGSIALLFASTGCVAVVGTPEGIRAYGDSQNGLITNGKASPDQKTAYWNTREHRETEESSRQNAPGFMSKLWGVK